MTADKPQAGRTCKAWCGTIDYPRAAYVVLGEGAGYCTSRCAELSRPLNPAPRPVDKPSRFSGWPPFDKPPGYVEPRPVERCSCEEATRYKAALEAIRDEPGVGRYGRARAIARRALALGGEEP